MFARVAVTGAPTGDSFDAWPDGNLRTTSLAIRFEYRVLLGSQKWHEVLVLSGRVDAIGDRSGTRSGFGELTMTSNDVQHASIGTSIMGRLSATVVVVCNAARAGRTRE
jgi:hypothetical protein